MQPVPARRARGLLAGFLAGLTSAAGTAGAQGTLLDEPWDWVAFAVRLVISILVVGLLVPLVLRRKSQSPITRRRLRVRRAVTEFRVSGRHEEGLDPAGWLPALEDRRRELVVISAVTTGLGALLLVLVVGAALRTDPRNLGIWVVAVVVGLVFGHMARVLGAESRAARQLASLLRPPGARSVSGLGGRGGS